MYNIDSDDIIKGLEELYGKDLYEETFIDYEEFEEYEKISERDLKNDL